MGHSPDFSLRSLSKMREGGNIGLGFAVSSLRKKPARTIDAVSYLPPVPQLRFLAFSPVMTGPSVSSDGVLLDLLRGKAGLTIHELADALGVTATAVRQRLTRLMAQGLIGRRSERGEKGRAGRGRPNHVYELTPQGQRSAGSNFSDLAMVLWEELRAIPDPAVRRGLLARVSHKMADRHGAEVNEAVFGDRVEEAPTAERPLFEPPLFERMERLSQEYRRRAIPLSVDRRGDMPVLNAHACPYPDLAEHDRSICEMETLLFSEIVGEPLKLSQCRVAGDRCCSFEPSGAAGAPQASKENATTIDEYESERTPNDS
jgi:predicted ArsR family transcriptional regulator